jgi:SpoVK/Ycf46/Vps4 family AAA+-type ATPase
MICGRLLITCRQLAADVDLDRLARDTPGYSGSDLYELCRVAATTVARESLRAGALVEVRRWGGG